MTEQIKLTDHVTNHLTNHLTNPALGAPGYRAAEMQMLARWIVSGVSGSVVGLVGSGRSSFLRYFCDHPDQVQRYLPVDMPPVVLVAIDLYDLPSNSLADLYRSILHAFYWIRERLPAPFAQHVTSTYLEYRTTLDPFLAQKAVYEVVRPFHAAGIRVVMVMNRFDTFCETSTNQQVNTLRSLRDRFKETLSYIVGMRQEVMYMPDPAVLGDMYELFDSHVCQIGALSVEDSHAMLNQLFKGIAVQPTQVERATLLQLSGGMPSLLKAIGQWWYLKRDQFQAGMWLAQLLREVTIQHRLERLWLGLTQEEQQLLAELYSQDVRMPKTRAADTTSRLRQHSIQQLIAKGCCWSDGKGYHINGELFAEYIAQHSGRVRGRIWMNERERIIYQGKQAIEELTPLEYNILSFLIANPGIRHSSDTIIDRAWPEHENKEVVTPNNLQVHVANIRKKIEPNPAIPRYIITWSGKPGGYLCFPEGKPGS